MGSALVPYDRSRELVRREIAYWDRTIALPARPRIRGLTLFGIAVFIILIGGFGFWASWYPLAEASLAQGFVKVEMNRRSVQHAEGGIVREILVREGDQVAPGQVLVRLDPVQAAAQLQGLETQRLALLVHAARLEAELDGATHIRLPDEVVLARGRPEVAEMITGQTAIFEMKRAAWIASDTALRARQDQLQATIDALTRQLTASLRQIELVREEAATVEELLRRGLERRPRLLALQRSEAALIGTYEEQQGQIARSRAQIEEIEQTLTSQRQSRSAEAGRELRTVRERLIEVEERLIRARDISGRLELRAPIGGTVMALKVNSDGAVVRPAEPLLDIVPEERLVADLRISPLDIARVHVGAPIELRFPSFPQRNVPPVHAELAWISPDADTEQHSGMPFYTGRVLLDEAALAQIPGGRVVPGMPVEASIITGERTMIEYLLKPILDSFRKSFVER
jgi:HlyD family type I secretion membrane fusion protein